MKLPPFSGKETWKIWFNRFTEVAAIQRWSSQRRLMELLPRLQGPAGEFVYGQLSHATRTNYSELVKELNSRFRVVETTRTFGAQFSKCAQKPGQTAEEFAAELKMLYDKAHANRDRQTRHEDLLRKFLDGLYDERARFHVEFVKEPCDIDQAVFEVVNFQETRRRPLVKENADGRPRRAAHAVREVVGCTYADMVRPADDDDNQTSDEEEGRVARAPVKAKSKPIVKPDGSSSRGPESSKKEEMAVSTPASTVPNALQSILEKIEGRLDKLEKQKSKPSIPNQATQQERREQVVPRRGWNRDNLQCYNCGLNGHFARDCLYHAEMDPRSAGFQPPNNYAQDPDRRPAISNRQRPRANEQQARANSGRPMNGNRSNGSPNERHLN